MDIKLPASAKNLSPILIISGYAMLTILGATVHEPWFDEAQSWLLVRDLPLGELLGERLRYEGHPPLWYLVLWPFVRLELPYSLVNGVAVGAGILGTALLVVNQRVPLALRATLPFTYYFAYQYAVIARSYVLLLPLLAALLLLAQQWKQRILTFALLLVGLSYVSLHGAVLALGLALQHLFDLWKSEEPIKPSVRRRHLLAGSVLGLSWLVLAWILFPPPALWIAPALDFSMTPAEVLSATVLGHLENISGPDALSLLLLGPLAYWIVRSGPAVFFVVSSLGLGALHALYSNFWHLGLFYLCLVYSVLLALDRDPPRPSKRRNRLRAIALACFAVTIVVQLRWTALTYAHDVNNPYSGSEATADFIREHELEGEEIFGAGYSALAVLPYFEQNLFANYELANGAAFWDWSTRNPWHIGQPNRFSARLHEEWMRLQLERRPDLLLVSQKTEADRHWVPQILGTGEYEIRARFPGTIYFRDQVEESEAFILFERVAE